MTKLISSIIVATLALALGLVCVQKQEIQRLESANNVLVEQNVKASKELAYIQKLCISRGYATYNEDLKWTIIEPLISDLFGNNIALQED